MHYDDSAIDGDYLDYGAQLDPVGALQPMSVANAQLIADAPLLLEEVKRLRELKIAEEEELERLSNRAEFYEGEYILARRTNQERLAEVERLRENLKRIRHTVFYDIEENFTDEQAYDPVLIEIMEKMKAVL